MALCVGLAGTLSLALIRPAVALHVVEGNPLTSKSDGALSATKPTIPLLPWESARISLKPPIQNIRAVVEPDEP
jgi:hypothetical protein